MKMLFDLCAALFGTAYRDGMKTSAPLTLLPALGFAKRCDTSALSLQLFAEAAPAAAAAGGEGRPGTPDAGNETAGGAAENGSAKAFHADPETAAKAGLSREAKRQARAAGERVRDVNPLAAVRYGRQSAEAAGSEAGGNTDSAAEPLAAARGTAPDAERGTKRAEASDAAEKAAAFEKLIRGEYKEQFAARTQSILDRRFKETRTQQAQSQKTERLLSRLAERYGVDAGDFEAIERAAAADDAYTEQQARAKGLPVDEVRRVKALESENARLRAEYTRRTAEDAARRTADTWLRDSKALKQTYPAFEFQHEAANPEFARLLKAGVSLRTAYESVHFGELLGGAMKYAADKAAEGVAGRVADRARRPAENGTLPRARAVVKTDVGALSRADREEIERRVARGEKILF